MAENPNEALHHKGHAAFAANDNDTLGLLIADDSLWHVAGKSLLSGDYRGREAVFGFFAKLGELSGGTLEIQDDEILGGEERTVALFTLTATRGDKTLNADFCEVVRWRDGQVIEDWGFAFDQYTYDEFWS